MAEKFLELVNGRQRQNEALVVSAGAGDAGKIIALDAAGRLDNSVMPTGIGADTKALTASEALAAANIVNVWNDGGTAKARKADASTVGKEGVGFVLASAASGATATVYFEGTITGLSGLTPGARYYLSAATPGVITDTPPSGAGNVVQYIGTALSATELSFEPADAIELA
jgi:hypothetical protein